MGTTTQQSCPMAACISCAVLAERTRSHMAGVTGNAALAASWALPSCAGRTCQGVW